MFIVSFFEFGDVWYPISFPPNGSYQKFLLRTFWYCELPGNEPVTKMYRLLSDTKYFSLNLNFVWL